MTAAAPADGGGANEAPEGSPLDFPIGGGQILAGEAEDFNATNATSAASAASAGANATNGTSGTHQARDACRLFLLSPAVSIETLSA